MIESAVLSEAQIAEFEERGVLRIDLGVDEQVLDSIREKVYPLYPQEFRDGEVPLARVQDAWKKVDEVRQLAINSRALQALEQLYGRKALAFQTLSGWYHPTGAFRYHTFLHHTCWLHGGSLGGAGRH